ncbi:Druantia anti-phage system protein DruA [Bradyrhizobium sp. Bra64]|uniref:Druantia anti-phage system protein DruA n=1 Tax=Bradyrhizobium sp. Bra64 TaxID=2926009 RepID=UPI002118F1CB
MSAIDITPKAVTTAASRRLLAEFVRDLSVLEADLEEIKSIRLGARRRFLAEAGKLKTKDKLGLIASALVIADLVEQGWLVKKGRNERVLAHRPFDDDEEVRMHKRRRYHAARDAQLRQPATRAFIERMERGALTRTGRHSIFSLMRDGRHLQFEISGALSGSSGKTLSELVRPYIQFVSSAGTCSITGLALQDIWRYFRHTWSNPYESVPGRSMLFLVRDGAAPNHPVMGIGAISSAAVQLEARDRFIGWLGEDIVAACKKDPNPEYADWALATIDQALKAIYRQDFLEKGLLPAKLPKHVPQQTIAKLQKLAAKSREDHFSRAAAGSNKAGGDATGVTAADWHKYARSPLFTAKRAREIAVLLETRNTIHDAWDGVPKAKRVETLLESASGRAAFTKVVRLARSMTVGTEIADLTVCGAVPPYNVLLGGKLVAMLAASPEVVLEYRRRYQSMPSIIASSMAGRAIVRSANLVFIGTTSLYGERPNQYDRTSYPCGIVGGPIGETVRYAYLTTRDRSRTSGVGTFQFGRDTKAAIEQYTSSITNGRRVNNVFGEGTSPKLRSLRDGLNALGLNSEEMLQHGIEKVVYGVPLVANPSRYLLRLDETPNYLFSLVEAEASTAAIGQHWFERWAVARMKREETEHKLQAHTLVRPIRHGSRVVLPSNDDDQLSFRID